MKIPALRKYNEALELYSQAIELDGAGKAVAARERLKAALYRLLESLQLSQPSEITEVHCFTCSQIRLALALLERRTGIASWQTTCRAALEDARAALQRNPAHSGYRQQVERISGLLGNVARPSQGGVAPVTGPVPAAPVAEITGETWEARRAKARACYAGLQLRAAQIEAQSEAVGNRAHRDTLDTQWELGRRWARSFSTDRLRNVAFDFETAAERLQRANRPERPLLAASRVQALTAQQAQWEEEARRAVGNGAPYLPRIAFTGPCPVCRTSRPFTPDFSDPAFVRGLLDGMPMRPTEAWECVGCYRIFQLCSRCKRQLAEVSVLPGVEGELAGRCASCLTAHIQQQCR